jgi:hypothetical protein
MEEARKLTTVKENLPVVPVASTIPPAEVRTYFADIPANHYQISAAEA